MFQTRSRKPLRRVPGRRNQPLLRLLIAVDLRTQSLSLPDVVDTRSEPQLVAGCQLLAIRERPRGAWLDRAHDLPEGSPSIRDSTSRVVTERPVSQHPSACQGDAIARLPVDFNRTPPPYYRHEFAQLRLRLPTPGLVNTQGHQCASVPKAGRLPIAILLGHRGVPAYPRGG